MDNEKLEIKENTIEPKKKLRDTLYGKIDVSVESMDKFIIACIALLGIAIVMSIATK